MHTFIVLMCFGMVLSTFSINHTCTSIDSILLSASDQEILTTINSSTSFQEEKLSCLILLFNRGYYQTCKHIISKNPDLSSELDKLISQRRTKINSFLQQLQMPTSTIQPSVKWAQNISHVFIHFKLSHRLDSPPCVNVKNQLFKSNVVNASSGIQIIEGDQSKLQFSCECVVSHQRIHFQSIIQFQGQIINLDVKKQGYGGITIMAQKQQHTIWRWLDKSHRRLPFWQQLKQKYKTDMDKYFQMIEQQEQKNLKKKKNKRKKINVSQL